MACISACQAAADARSVVHGAIKCLFIVFGLKMAFTRPLSETDGTAAGFGVIPHFFLSEKEFLNDSKYSRLKGLSARQRHINTY